MIADPRQDLEENVFPWPEIAPTKDDGDANGNVLWFSPAHGWSQGWWKGPFASGVSHWTYLPPRPPAAEDPNELVKRKFDQWIQEFPAEFDEPTKALMLLGWRGAARCLARLLD